LTVNHSQEVKRKKTAIEYDQIFAEQGNILITGFCFGQNTAAEN